MEYATPVYARRERYIERYEQRRGKNIVDANSEERTILEISGTDRLKFVNDLVTNRIAEEGHLTYAALLSPQGKYLFDFFLFQRDGKLFLDVKSDCADALHQRLMMYRLRADVTIARSELKLCRGFEDAPEGAYADPRHNALGWRRYCVACVDSRNVDWDAIRVRNVIPETGVELVPNESYILEMGFERLNGVDFRKGCYVGQEVTARMKHKTELRKGLVRVTLSGEVAPGKEIECDGKVIGTIHTVSGSEALAYLRFDQAGAGTTAGGVDVSLQNSE